MEGHGLLQYCLFLYVRKLKFGELKWLFQVHTVIQWGAHSEFWLLSSPFSSMLMSYGFSNARERALCRSYLPVLSGLSKEQGIRWRLSTEHLLISIEHLISSCCFVKSSDKKRSPFLFIFSWETLSPFLLFNETCFLMRNSIRTLL